MKNIYQRNVDLSSLKGKPYGDYKPEELVAYLTTAYPGDPVGMLLQMQKNYEIGLVLAGQTKTLLEGLK